MLDLYSYFPKSYMILEIFFLQWENWLGQPND